MVLKLIFYYKIFHIIDVIGDMVMSENACTFVCDEQIIFDAYAAEIFVFLNNVEVEELFVCPVLLPKVYKGRNKVYARFISYYESGL